MSDTQTSLKEFLDITTLKNPKNYVQSLLKTVHSKNITIEDWNIFIYQLQELLSHDMNAYLGFKSVLAELSTVYDTIKKSEDAVLARVVTLEDTVGLSPDGQYIHVPIEYGKGVDSIIQKATNEELANKAIASRSVSVGTKTISGMLGFWIEEITVHGSYYYIRLTAETDIMRRPYPRGLGTGILEPRPGFPLHYGREDEIWVCTPDMTYPRWGKIVDVRSDVITVYPSYDWGEFDIYDEEELKDFRQHPEYYSIAVPYKPLRGIVPVSGHASYSEGYKTVAADMYTHTEGADTIARGGYGHSEGFDTQSVYAAHSQNAHTRALAKYSTAGGFSSEVTGYSDASTVFGINLHIDDAYAAFACGGSNSVYADYGYAEGFENTVDVEGLQGHVEGNGCYVSGYSGHAQNGKTQCLADYGDASGFQTFVAFGANAARAAGEKTTVRAPWASADGYNNTVTSGGMAGHASGISNALNGKAAYVGGEDCIANYWAEFVHGRGLRSSSTKLAQAVFGNYNRVNDDAVFQVGNGVTNNARSNAFEVISTRTGNTNYVSLKVGNTVITEAQLKQLLALVS